MQRILVLSTWFPYPLYRGAKVRAYHLIKALAKEYEIALISFAEEEIETDWIDHMRNYCISIDVIQRDPFKKNRLKSIAGLFSIYPRSMFSAFSVEMERRVNAKIEGWKPDIALALTVITSPYLMKVSNCIKILDVDNILTRMLYETYRQSEGVMKRIRGWVAYQKFFFYEKKVFHNYDLCINVSEADRNWVNTHFSVPCEKLGVVPNGSEVSAHMYSEIHKEPNQLIYNGSLTYEANADAMKYFVKDIFPLICAKCPNTKLIITGKYESVPLDWIPQDGSVTLTGNIEEIHSMVKSSAVCVVPLRKGAGTRIKILEAMALGTPVVSTTKGVEGLDVVNGQHVLIGDNAEQFAQQTIRLLIDQSLRNNLAMHAQKLVCKLYNWEDIGNNWRHLVNTMSSSKDTKGK